MKKQRQRIGWVLLALALASCSRMPPRHATAMDDIQSTLETAAKSNAEISDRLHSPSTESVANLLMPTANMNLPVQEKGDTDQRFNLSVDRVPAQAFFSGLAKDTPNSIIVHPNVTGEISLSLKHVTLEEALEAVRDSYGFDFQRTRYGYEIFPPGLQTRVFHMNYLNISRHGTSEMIVHSGQPTNNGNAESESTDDATETSATDSSSGPAPSSFVETETRSNFWLALKASLDSMVGASDGRSVVVQPGAGIIVVRAEPDELRQVKKYLHEIQTNMRRQVLLEAKVLEVELSDGFQSGINWKLLGFQQGSDLNKASASGFTNVFLWHLHTENEDFESFIKLLSTEGNVQVLSSPRVSTVNNQKAVIKVGSDEYFVTGISTTTVSNTTTDTTEDINMTPFFSGIALDVTPQIDRAGEVILHIHPSISEVTQQEKDITLGSKQVKFPSALSSIRESDSIVRAHSGEIVVIGGLMKNKTTETINGTPVLGRLPFVGAAFRNTKQSSTKSELVILLKPIVVGEHTWENQMRKISGNFKRFNRGFHAGDRPEIFGNLAEKSSQWEAPKASKQSTRRN